jgi:hypothetical protein
MGFGLIALLVAGGAAFYWYNKNKTTASVPPADMSPSGDVTKVQAPAYSAPKTPAPSNAVPVPAAPGAPTGLASNDHVASVNQIVGGSGRYGPYRILAVGNGAGIMRSTVYLTFAGTPEQGFGGEISKFFVIIPDGSVLQSFFTNQQYTVVNGKVKGA